jgi:glycerate kinase
VKIVIALDKFKGTLSAPKACEIVGDAFREVRPDWDLVVKPMADGGDGTAEVLCAANNGQWVSCHVTGPLSQIGVSATYVWIERERMAVIEVAAASGLVLLKPEQRNPLETTTYGTGELIRYAVERGARKILLGVGGSATVDGGVGAAMALGWRFLDATGQPVGRGGGELQRIAKIEVPVGRDRRARRTDGRPSGPSLPAIEVLCDVDNPLCGEHGAARVFGPQKGATPEMVERLDAGLHHLARLVKEQLGKEILNVPGAGAAGGLAAGAIAFMCAKLVPGIDTVMEASGLEDALRGADWVITGEGKFDEQSLRGKVVSGVTKLARKHRVKVAVLAGSVNVSKPEGIEIALATRKEGMSLDYALANADKLLAERARELGRVL